MKNDIKELLFLLHNDRLSDSGKRKLEDYITDLQKANKNHSKKLIELEGIITILREEMEKLRSAYIGERLKNDKVIHFICYEYRPQRPTTKEEEIIINILQGGIAK